MEFTGSVRGVAELEKTFRNMPRSSSRKAYMAALRAGASVVRNLAQANLKAVTKQGYATGTAERSLRVYNLRKYRGSYRVAVQIKKGMVNTKKIVNGKPVRVGLYVSVLEYGKTDGTQPPRSWIRKAIREGKDAAVAALRKEMSLKMVEVVKDAKR